MVNCMPAVIAARYLHVVIDRAILTPASSCCLHSVADMYGDSPMAYPGTHNALKDHIAAVYGICIYFTSASQPAAVPRECNGQLPNSCPSPRLYGLNTIRAPLVWNALPGDVNENPTASVMVIDSGIRATHQDLTPNLLPELTVTAFGNIPVRQPLTVSPTPALEPIINHGTHVSGTVFARWNNAIGAAGVVGRARGGSCGCGTGPRSLDGACLTNCINYAAEQGVRVINLSWGRTQAQVQTVSPERDAIVRFCNQGGLIAIAAGNGEQASETAPFIGRNIIRPDSLVYPSAYAADLQGRRALACICFQAHSTAN